MKDVAQSWMERSSYDLDTAKAMLESGRYLYVLFCCQQAIEKALKALVVEREEVMPPRIHNLLGLAEKAGIELTEEQRQWLARMSAYYIQSRYPEEIGQLGARITADLAAKIMGETEETIQWLKSTTK